MSYEHNTGDNPSTVTMNAASMADIKSGDFRRICVGMGINPYRLGLLYRELVRYGLPSIEAMIIALVDVKASDVAACTDAVILLTRAIQKEIAS